ncbi:MAG: aminodeoxychorismate/anthranilate synthase component II [Bacteroidia bacterium]
MILIIDNYDSFTYNLADLLRRFVPVTVHRNDAISLADIEAMKPRGVLISPGPGKPEDSGVCLPLLQKHLASLPVLGVCLGHQLLGEVLGATVLKAGKPMHGKTSLISHDGSSVFKGLPSPLRVMRYHSLVLKPESLPPGLRITAQTAEGEVMGLAHAHYPLHGVQFHPESILSEFGEEIVKNWLNELKLKGPY